MSKNYFLTKTTFISGYQCLKKLYLEVKHPELESPETPEARVRKEVGMKVGIMAHSLFPGGVLITERGVEAVERTKKEIPTALTLFEATFMHEGVLVRIDVLNRENLSAPWRIIEVKSSTKVKAEHIPDMAIQLFVAQNSGLKVGSVHLLRIHNKSLTAEPIDLLMMDDATAEVKNYLEGVPDMIAKMKDTLDGSSEPTIQIGKHCDKPYDCGFRDYCWKSVPEVSVLDLYREPVQRRFELYHNGTVKLTDSGVNPSHAIGKRMVDVERSGKRYVEKAGIKKAIKAWKLPFYHLDFETMNPGIPRFENHVPYQKIPIQFSVHFQEKVGGPVTQKEYLHDDGNDPREALAKSLCEAIGDSGSVMAFNAAFEEGVIKELAALFPKYSEKLLSIVNRLVDPQDVFRNFVYDSGFRGSFSLKTVAPAILGKEFDYDSLEVQHGDLVAILYDEMNAPETTKERREAIRKSILDYCRQDTLAMAKLVDWLFAQAK